MENKLIIGIILLFLIPITVNAQGFGHCEFGNYLFGNCVLAEGIIEEGGGGDSGTPILISQLKCDQLAQEHKNCLTYNPNTNQCDIGCSEGICGENYICISFNKSALISLNQIISPIKDKEQCIKNEFIYFKDVCYECNGKLVDYQGTTLCDQYPKEKTKEVKNDDLNTNIILGLLIITFIGLAMDDQKKQKLKKKQQQIEEIYEKNEEDLSDEEEKVIEEHEQKKKV